VIENILASHYGDDGQSADDVIPSCRNYKNGIKNGINIVGNVKNTVLHIYQLLLALFIRHH
jgi:hypothetical protein